MSVSKSSLFLVRVLLVLMQSYEPILSKAGDTISAGQFLLGNQTIVSERNTFQLGFFKPGNYNMYLGISYKDHPGKKNDVWVANRNTPLSNQPSLRYGLSLDGNLVITQGSSVLKLVWSTNLTHSSLNSTEAILFDSGNLVLRDKLNHSRIFWESFDHPIDVWLPGQKLRISKVSDRLLTSWKNQQDPTSGIFSLGIDRSNASSSIELYLQWNKSLNYWRSGVWNGQYFKNARDMKASDVYNFTYISTENESYLTYGVSNLDTLTKIYLGHRGQLQLHVWLDEHWNWKSLWQEPRSSSVYALCGAFGLFHEYDSELCECLQGFSPSSKETRLNDWSNGCVRRYPLNCNISDHEAKDWFFRLQNVTLPANEKYFSAFNNASCEIACMRNCSCTAFVHNSSGCLIWDGVLLNLQQFSDGTNRLQDIYLKLSAAEIQHTHGAKDNSNRKRVLETILPVCIGALLLILSLCLVFIKVLKVKGESNEDLLSFDFNSNPQIADDEHDNQSQRKQDVELPAFSYKSVCATTDKFSEANKLGEGGFGPVYKGKLTNGYEIAAKRLSRCSVQGLEEFRNETKLIAKLQHRNLVRLLGCCIQLGEKILIYEYMPNGSLDSFLFDATKRQELDWGTRIGIIEGIAQGLLYLHQHSRLRIIHRDLKPSNILLDSEMNPKISDFGLARIFGGSEMQANTGRIVGTYGYMPPEYAIWGIFSIKSDVFSFGVLLLEIVSGKKNRSVYKELSLNLLGYAWELWTSDRGMDLLDPTLECPPSWNHAVPLRYINIGLLCVQEIPSDRPTMVDIVSMLASEHEPLPNPKQPAFTIGRHESKTSAASSSSFVPSDASLNYMTQSNVSGR